MKIAIQLGILSRLIDKFNQEGRDVKNIPDKYIKNNYWDQECLEHPTNNSCLIYCD